MLLLKAGRGLARDFPTPRAFELTPGSLRDPEVAFPL